ncbi:hypothetical protein HHI36_010171 [Cryptolaemus montrouzieri]|uniref:YLP motif-containing protein 1 n=1 Tax=Cryptolaemus montrouzieri TaxID=559131 RepID=A0ABD2MI46_9CUCU
MSWSQWPGAAAAQPPVVAATPSLINPAPSVLPPGLPYSTDQWSQLQQQNWQQWAQWQQQYQQWHQQYGAEYQKSMNALAARAVVPNMGVPPPLPIDAQPQPPLPQEEIPKPAPPLPMGMTTTHQPSISQYSTQPPPSNNFSAPPPNFTPTPQQNWRGPDGSLLEQKRGLGTADESANKRQMINRQDWRNPNTSTQPPPQLGPDQNASKPEELSEAEKKFDKQFAEWEAQFNKWKEQNSGHPDKQQYKEYEKKWEQWRQQLLERREAMRKKRLGISSTSKGTATPNCSIPPPAQAQGSYTSQPPPLIPQNVSSQRPSVLPNDGPQKENLQQTPNLFSKPPPDMNDEPLQFKNSEAEPESTEGSLGFLNSSKSEGIPGLDLVKDGDVELKDDEVEEIPQKGPDLEAISKGINNILGDQKLMSMLSMVSQNQNIQQNTNISTTSKINDVPSQDQSNLSAGDSRIDTLVETETVQNFDDQTRSSFTMQPSDSDLFRGAPMKQFGRNNFDSESPFNKPFGMPNDEAFRRPPPNSRFGGGMNNSIDENQFLNRNSGHFDRPPPGNMIRNSINFNRPPPGNMGRDDFGVGGPEDSGRRNAFGPPGPGNMNRDSFGPGPIDKGSIGPEENLNRDNFPHVISKGNLSSPSQGNSRMDNFGFGNNRNDFSSPSEFGMNRSELNASGPGFPPARGGIRDRFEPPGRGNMGRGNFEHNEMNRDNFRTQNQFEGNNLGPDRDNFGGRQIDDKYGPRGTSFRGRRDSRSEEFDYNNENFDEILPNRFGRPLLNQKFAEGPGDRRNDFNETKFNDKRDFNQMRLIEGNSFRNDGIPYGRDSFQSEDGFNDRFERSLGDRPPFSRNVMATKPDRFEMRDNLAPRRLSEQSNLRDERGLYPRDNFDRRDFGEEDDYPPPPLFGPSGQRDLGYGDNSLQRQDSFGNSMMDAPEPPSFDDRHNNKPCENQFNPDVLESKVDPPGDIIWNPGTVIDYDHKPLNTVELDVLVEPFRMFDYRHKSLRRIPFPERPNWLSDSVRMIPEFDPPIIRPPPTDRRFEGRFEAPPQRRDDYDVSRMDDRRRYDRRGYGRDLSPSPSKSDIRNRGYEEDIWSGRRNRSRSPPTFDKSPPRFEKSPPRFERGRAERPRSKLRDGTERDWEHGDNEWEKNRDWRGGSKDWKDRGRDWKDENKEVNWRNKNSDWKERERQWEEDDMDLSDRERSRERDVLFRKDRNSDRDFEKEKFNKRRTGQIFPLSGETKQSNVTLVEDLISPPGRFNRPQRIVIILRGPPGSGKTFLAKLIKDKEVENGGSAPRILSLDDYFMVEQEKEVMEDGKRIKMKDMVYEFEAEMEESYRTSLMRSFKKTITDGYFPFIIVDNVNDKVKYFGEMWSFAKQNGFQVYICQMDLDIQNCVKRNIHNRSEEEIRNCVDGWEKTPAHHPILDVTSILQDEPIAVVEMEEINSPGSENNGNEEGLEVRGYREGREEPENSSNCEEDDWV